MAKRPIVDSADGRPRIYLRQVLRDGRYYGEWRRHPTASGRIELTLALAFQAALHAIDNQPAVIIFEGIERIEV